MISPQSIAVAAAATSMHKDQEGRLFRFTLRQRGFLAAVVGLIVPGLRVCSASWAP